MVHVFVFDQYYPNGGLNDYKGTFPDEPAAMKAIEEKWLNYDYFELAITNEDGTLSTLKTGRP